MTITALNRGVTEGGSHLSAIADASGSIYLSGSSALPNLYFDFQTLKFQPTIPISQPTILALPQHLHVVMGTNRAVFFVEAGNGPNTFQWRFRGAPIPGATNATLELHDIQLTNAGPYSIIVSNSYGYVVTPDARLTVYEPPRIQWRWHQRTNDVVIVGNQLLLPTDFEGNPPITFEWFKDGVAAGQTNSMFVIDELGRADAGVYTVVARSPYGAATNAPLSLTVVDRSPLDDWRWIRPRPQGNWLTAVAFGNGRFVAVGDAGTLLTSDDGLSWAVTNLHRSNLTGCAFGNGSFVAVSSLGAIYTSIDGFSWTQRQGSTTHHRFGRVAFLNNQFVLSGSRMASSPDGVTWTDHGPGVSGRLTFGQGKYLTSAYGQYMVSTNLSNWTTFPLEEAWVYRPGAAAYGHDMFVVLGEYDLYTSPDGVEITRDHSINANGVAFLNDSFFAFGRSIERSLDGVTWSTVFNQAHDLQSMAYGNGAYVAVGSYGEILRSSDSATWTRVSDLGGTSFRLLAYGNGHYVAIAHEDTWSSFDGDNWTSVGPLQGYPTAITWANDRFVVTCRNGDIHTSRDGLQWTLLALTTNYLSDVIHDGKRFIAVGNETVLLSTNGTQWITVPVPGTNLHTITYGKGIYVAVAVNTWSWGIWISTNAIHWQNVADNNSVGAISYGNGRFVGVSLGNAVVSDDGRTWRSYEISRQYAYDAVVFAAGTFIAFGSYANMATSTNGQDWVVHNVWLGGGIEYANGALWNAGDDETIMRSGQIEPALRASKVATGVQFTLLAYPGQPYRLQRAATLGTWTDFQTFTPQTETTTFTDNNPSSQGAFFRVVSP